MKLNKKLKPISNIFCYFVAYVFLITGLSLIWSMILCLLINQLILLPFLRPIFDIKIFGSIIGFSTIYLIINFTIYLINQKSLNIINKKNIYKYLLLLLINSTLYSILLSPLYFISHYIKISIISQIFFGTLAICFAIAIYSIVMKKDFSTNIGIIQSILIALFLIIIFKFIIWIFNPLLSQQISIFISLLGIILSIFFIFNNIKILKSFYKSLNEYEEDKNLFSISLFGSLILFNELIHLFTFIFYLVFSFCGYNNKNEKEK